MDESILESIKKMLGLPAGASGFDFELSLHISSALSTLNQLGVGPANGLTVEDDTVLWSDLLGSNQKLNNAKSYVFYRVKMIFDSANMPAHLITAYNERIKEEEWRLQIEADPYIPQAADTSGLLGEISDLEEDLQEHIDSEEIPSLSLTFENNLI